MRKISCGRQFALCWTVAIAAVISSVLPAAAEAKLVGVVIDYAPRGKISGKPAIAIKHEGQLHPVREQQIIYEGDIFVFDPAAGQDAYVKALVDSQKQMKFDRQNFQAPAPRWPLLEALLPKLLTAYRWVNDTSSSEETGPLNAISRDVEEGPPLEVLPNLQGDLLISNAGKEPLWIGWAGGTPPFKLVAQSPGKPAIQAVICEGVDDDKCGRETTLDLGGDSDETVQVTIESSDGSTWTQSIARKSDATPRDAAEIQQLGDLGTFLAATQILDRGHGEYVLESARKLASISKTYPPARALLDKIRDGRVP